MVFSMHSHRIDSNSYNIFWASYFVLNYVCVYVFVIICTHEWSCLWKPEDEVRYPGAGVTSGSELSNVGAGD